jgi:hypothetical protein
MAAGAGCEDAADQVHHNSDMKIVMNKSIYSECQRILGPIPTYRSNLEGMLA